jgi:hypothetical protein
VQQVVATQCKHPPTAAEVQITRVYLRSTQAKPDARRAFLISKPNHTQQTADVVANLKSQLQDPSQHRTNKATT